MEKDFKVLILNAHRFPSSIFRYGMDIRQATGGRTEFINIVFNRSAWPLEYAPLCAFGRFSHPSMNYLFRNIAFPDLPRRVQSVHSAGGIIHYASTNITPLLRERSRCVVTVHDNPKQLLESDMYSEVKKGLTEKLIRNSHHRVLRRNVKIFRKFRNILADTEYVKRAIQDYEFEGEVTVIPPAVSQSFTHIDDKAGLRRKLHLPTSEKLILSVSTLARRKNVEMVHKTMELLGDGYRLVRLGPPVGNSITFSSVDMETVNEIYNASDVLLFPTLEEGFGYPVVEAFKTGLPVVASDIEVIREVAADAAILVNPLDPSAVAKGVVNALKNSKSLVQRGYVRANSFTFALFTKRMIEYYGGLS